MPGLASFSSRADRAVTPALNERWQRDLAQPIPHRWWVAEREGRIAGFAGIGPSRDPVNPRLGEFDTIAVDPPHWRTGVGRALVTVALRYLVADGYRQAIVWTVKGYEQGIAFYEAMGWRRGGGMRDDGRQISFRRELAPSESPRPCEGPIRDEDGDSSTPSHWLGCRDAGDWIPDFAGMTMAWEAVSKMVAHGMEGPDAD